MSGAQAGPVVTASSSAVAAWLGVSKNVVTNWCARRDDIPAPDVVVVSASGSETWGWLPGRRGEWELWNAARIASPRRPRRRYAGGAP